MLNNKHNGARQFNAISVLAFSVDDQQMPLPSFPAASRLKLKNAKTGDNHRVTPRVLSM